VLRKLGSLIMGLLLGGVIAASASTISDSGTFLTDDQVVLFHYIVQADGFVTVETTSYAANGFQTVLTVFDSAHSFLFADGGYSEAADASLTWFSTTGEEYIVALTQYDNVSGGPGSTLEDGFALAGQGNYTADIPYNVVPGGSFLLPGGEQRTADWTVVFSAPDPVGLIVLPEPSTFVLFAGGTAAFLFLRRRKIGA
jgi:hypothetical protein